MNNTSENWKGDGYTYIEGLPPIIFPGAKTLILGTLPGSKSLENRAYYMNKGNRFWPMMAEIFGTKPLITETDRLAFLEEHHIALWDVYKSGYRNKSKDSKIKDTTFNDIPGFLTAYPDIKQIVVAGKKAQKAFSQINGIQIPVIAAPSTSGGNGHWKNQKHIWYEIDY